MSVAELSTRIADAEQAKRLLEQIAPYHERVMEAWAERHREILGTTPWEDHKLRMLAFAYKAASEALALIRADIADGEVARSTLEHVRKIQNLSPEQRRYV